MIDKDSNTQLPETYKSAVNCCCNCRYVFHVYDHDSSSYFCKFKKPKMPIHPDYVIPFSPSVHYEVRMKQFTEWLQWSKNREVQNIGICDNWRLHEQENSDRTS